MKLKGIFAAMLLVVAGVQTAAQGFRVYKSDGTIMQFSLRTDSIVFYDGIGSDQDFGPFTPVNQCIVGTWYKTRNETVTFREDGTTDYVSGATYEFMPYQGTIIINNASGMPVNILKVHKVTGEMLVVSTLGSTTFSVWSTEQPPQLVTSITLSSVSLSMLPGETRTITATVLPADADNKELEWMSSDEDVAVVGDFFGTITILAKGSGTCTISATAKDGSGVKGECQVAVNANANKVLVLPIYTETTTPEEVRNHAPHGLEIPSLSTGTANSLIVHTLPDGKINYCIGYNTTLKANCWTAFKWYSGFSSSDETWNRNRWRQGESFNGYGGTGDPFQPDPLLPADVRLTSADYDDWGYQRGHMLGSADRLNSKEANGQTFYLSNIMPQLKDFNEHGIWWNLESFLRNTYDQSSFRDTLYVVKGGTVSEGNYTRRGSGSQLVCPKYFFMAILSFAKKYAKTNGGYSAIAFWMEHKGNYDEVSSNFAITIDELERRTGIDFFCNLPDDIENAVEKIFYLSDWKLK